MPWRKPLPTPTVLIDGRVVETLLERSSGRLRQSVRN